MNGASRVWLLHGPPVANGWNTFLGAIHTRTIVEFGILELAVCRVAVLNDAMYEWDAHASLALKGGIKPEELHAYDVDRQVDQEVFTKLQTVGFNDREIVELTTGIAGYNWVSRFLVALEVGENNNRKMKSVDELVAALQ
ncbi:hypothetical protein N7486_003603 [Penicillium sp. IBT 16267x]|nr:hypothetical protein N7486_003603 [Penicillium sp. IBT 16267x]